MKLTWVLCDNVKCKWNKRNECKLKEITISDQENCMDVEYDE